MSACVINETGNHPVVLVCEHASFHIPPKFADLGLSGEILKSHIAWDPGAFETAKGLSDALDAPLVYSDVSRLVYDCNRSPFSVGAMPALSEDIEIPGNRNLSIKDREIRVEEFYRPFERLLTKVMNERALAPVLVTIHSFTPTFLGKSRSVEIGILHDEDSRLADVMLNIASGYRIERNQPYGPKDEVTHTLKQHAVPHGLLNVMIEVRNDLIKTPEQCFIISSKIEGWISRSLAQLAIEPRFEVSR